MARVIHKIIVEEKLVPVSIALVNKPGGGGAAGIGYVAASRKADPHTLILINGSTQITPILNPQAKTLTEVKPVTNMMLDDFLLFVRADAPWKTAADFVKDAKSKPAKSVAFSTGGTTDVMAVSVLSKSTGVQYNTVGFNSGGEALTALLGGHVQASMGNPLEFMGQLQGGKVRALGVVRDKRFPGLKDVPTFQEQGIKTPNFQMWRGIAIPKDAPDAAATYWAGVMAKVNASKTMQKYYADNVAQAATIPGKKFDAFLANQEKLYRGLLGK
jgi:putative tricarboxylic transport membrane protein